MRKLAALAVSTAAAATMFSTPAEAIEVCDPVVPRGVCVYVLDDRESCPPGYTNSVVPRIDNPVGGSILIVCFLL